MPELPQPPPPDSVAAIAASALFAGHPDPMLLCRACDAVVLALNESTVRLFRVDPTEVVGLSLATWLPLDAVAELAPREPDAQLRRVVIDSIPHPDGPRTMEFTSRQIASAEGPIAVLSLHDVTAHREAEHALRLSHQRFEYVSRATSDAVWDLDVATGAIWWNDRYFGIFGVDAEQEASTLDTWRERVHPDDVDRVAGSLDAVLHSDGSSWQERYRFRRGDGSWALVSDRGLVLRDAEGTPVRMVGGITDDTARLQAEDRVRESEARFRELVSHLNDVFWVLEVPPPRLSYVSPAVEALTGVSAERLLEDARAASGLLHPDDLELVARTLRKPDAQFSLEYRILKDGEIRWLHSAATPVRDEHGRVRRVAGVSRDITEQKRMAEQLLRTQRLESIGTLAGGIAHDLNNILAPISMSAQLMAERLARGPGGAEPEELLDWVHVIDDAARRGVNLVKQVLLFARGDEGERKPLDPRQLLRDLSRIIRDTFPKDIELRVLTQQDAWPIAGDATQLQQVLVNLAVNARDAMPGGGRLTISAHNAAADTAARESSSLQLAPGRYVRIRVADTGCGMTPEQTARIFDPFFTTKPVGKGTGLGLSTAMSIVRSHRGQIRVETAPQQGTMFEIWLPTIDGAPEADAPRRAPPKGSGQGILVVDDEAPIREVLEALLTSAGYRVWTARHGAEALETLHAQQGAIHVVLTDLTMPVLDGAGLAAAVAEHWPTLPVVATSGLVGELPDSPQIPSGVRAFLPKPSDADLLLQTLADVLRGM